MTSLLNVLGYPQSDWQTSTSYPDAYNNHRNAKEGENCRFFIDHIYTEFLNKIHKSVEYVSSSSGWTCFPGLTTEYPTHSYIPFGGSDGDNANEDDEGLSEWVLVAIVFFGIVGFLGFSGLLFLMIYKMYTHKTSVYPDSQARYRPAKKDEVTVNVTAERNATKAPPTPPPSYDNVDTMKPITID